MTNQERENILNKLTLIETSEFRKRGLEMSGKYTHEPKNFRSALYELFNKFNDEELKKLYYFKTKI
jgi:hypothetical protein